MAAGTGYGIDLSQLQDAVKKADDSLKTLQKTGEEVTNKINKAFEAVAQGGISKMTEGIDALNRSLQNVGKNSAARGVEKMFEEIGKYAENVIDKVNRVSTSVEKLASSNGKNAGAFGLEQIANQRKKLDQEIAQIQERYAELQKTFSHMSSPTGDNTAMKNIQAEVQFLMEYKQVLETEKNGVLAAQKALQEAKKSLSQKDPFKAKIDDLSGESLDARRYKDAMSAMKEFYAEQDKEAKNAAKKAESDRREREKSAEQEAKNASKRMEAERREREKNSREEARQAEILRKENEKAYSRSYEGAVKTSNRANTLAQEIQAVKNLEAARASLKKTDVDYEKKLMELNTRIRQHNENIARATAGANTLAQQHQALKNLAGGVGRALAGIFSVHAIRGYVNQLIEVRGEFELQHKSLQVLLGDKDKADELWNKTVDLAVKSPFRVKDLVTYTKQLAAYRVEADKLYETNKMLADVSAGLGVDMNRLILAFGQVKAANFLRGTELRQFSEAGVNMLEELSKRYTKLEGRMVSVGEVFERVSKRMVSFKDVEAVFQTITSEGGAFYQMQEKQSETLRGMIMNLKDSIDLMFNEIGESNDGLIKNAIKSVRDLVDNWRHFITILQEVGVAFALMKIPSIVKGLGSLGTSAYYAAKGIKKAGVSATVFGSGLARLTIGVKELTAALLSNPLFWGGAVVSALLVATHRLIRYNKEIEATNKQYDELSKREVSRIDKLNDLVEKADTYNKAIRDSKEELTSLKEGTKEYASVEGKLNDAISSNHLLLEQLKKDFPQIYSSVKTLEDGTLDLNGAIDAQNKLLTLNIALNNQSKKGWFHDDMATNVREATDALTKQRAAFSDLQEQAKTTGVELAALKDKGRVDDTSFIKLESLLSGIAGAKNMDEAHKLVTELKNIVQGDKSIPFSIYKQVGEAWDDYIGEGLDASKHWENLQESLERTRSSFVGYVTLAKEISPDKWQEVAAQMINESLKSYGVADKDLLAKMQQYIEDMLGQGELKWTLPPITYSEKDLKDEWRVTLWNAIKKVNESLGNELGENKITFSLEDMITLPKTEVFEKLSEQVKNTSKDIDDTISTGLIPTQQKFSKEQLTAASSTKPLIKSLSDLLGILEKSKGGGQDKVMEKLKNRISLIKEMNREYEKLNKTFSAAESLEKVRASYQNTAKELGLDLSQMDFTDEGTIASLEKLLGNPAYKGKKYAIELQKALDNYKVEIGIEVKKNADEAIKSEVERMFDSYELSLELKKLNIPKTLAKDLFNADVMALDELREGINQAFMGVEFYEERIKDAGKIMEETFNGNVDLLNRKLVPAQELAAKGWEDVGDGLATVFSSSYSVTDASGKEIDILVTPILPDGTVMSQNELEKYISTKIEGAKNVLDADDKGIIIHASTDMDEGMGEYLHSLQEVFYASDMLSEDQKKKYKEYIDKVRDLELKEQEDRLKMYVEYAKKGISERAKIKLEELRKLSEIEETFKPEATKDVHDIEKAKAEGATDEQIKILEEENKKIREGNKAVEERNALLAEQGRLASEAVRKESKEQTNKLEWEEFEKSDMFIRVFDDLDAASSSLLEHMISKIQGFKEEWTDMPLEDVEKIVDALNKLQLKLAESNPWGEFKKAKKDLEDAKKAVKFEDTEAKTLAEKGGEGNYMAALDKEDVAQQEKRDNAIEQIALLETQLAITEKIVATTDEERDIKAGLVSQIKKELTTQEGIKKSAEDNLKATGKVRAEHKRVKTALAAQYSATSECLNMAVELGGAISDLVGTLTDDDPAMVFAEMGLNMLTTVANTLALQAQLIAAQGAATGLGAAMNTAAGVIGWIVMAIQLLVTAISAAVNYADKMRQMSMDVLAGQVEHLKNKFDELAESIDEAWSYKQLEEYSKELDKVQRKMVSTQKQYVQLLRSGKDSEKTIATAEAAQAKLDAGLSVDSLSKKEKKALLSEEYEAYKQATEDLAEMEENYADQKKELLEELGGVADPKEAAEEFVDAWLEAYKETGDGLSGLDEKFDEFFENLIKKKAAMLVAEKALTGWVDAVNNALDMESSGGADITSEEQEAINKAAEDAKEKANKILLGIFEGMDFGEAEGEGLSGLQKGIQGITEDQADILAAYWNSVRGYTASIDAKFDALLASMGVSLENPQLVEMRNQSVILGEINLKMEAMNATIAGLVDASGKLKVNATTQLDRLIKPRANGGVGLNIVND